MVLLRGNNPKMLRAPPPGTTTDCGIDAHGSLFCLRCY